jgi:hypothetical protein
VTHKSLGVTALFLYSAGKCVLGIANNKDVFNVSVRRKMSDYGGSLIEAKRTV